MTGSLALHEGKAHDVRQRAPNWGVLMDKQHVGRREILRAAGVAAGGVALTTASMASAAHADDDDDDNDGRRKLNGSWMVTAVADGDPNATTSVGSFAAGDVAIIHDIKPAGPPFTGTWARTKGNGFRATVWTGFPGTTGPGSTGDTAQLEIVGRLLRDGTIAGTFTFTLFDAVTGDAAATFTGTFTGTRIAA